MFPFRQGENPLLAQVITSLLGKIHIDSFYVYEQKYPLKIGDFFTYISVFLKEDKR